MKNLLNSIMVAMVALALCVSAQAQSQPVMTTLATAANLTSTTITVASATGITASNNTTGPQYVLYVDREAMLIRSISGTNLTVQRGFDGSQTAHISGARVFIGCVPSPANSSCTGGPMVQSRPIGACTRSSIATLPQINIDNGDWYNCLGGYWVVQAPYVENATEPIIGPCNIPIGSVAYASVGTNTADIANKRMVTSIYVPYTGIYTGAQFLQGGTATTDNITFGLFDNAGNPIANAGATGVLLATANTFKSLPFTANSAGTAQTLTLVTGPARYLIGLNANGSTAGAIQTVPTATFKNLVSAGTTSVTFGTFAAFTPPTTFTADLAPIGCFYR